MSTIRIVFAAVVLLTSCSRGGRVAQLCCEADSLNTISYRYHYKDVDSLRSLALSALQAAREARYVQGEAEALNNLAFERFQQMDFDSAMVLSAEAAALSAGDYERLVADVTQMKVTQRTSDNRAFFLHRADALKCIARLSRREKQMSPRELHRYRFGRSDFHIVSSTYFYYLDQNERALEEIRAAEPFCTLTADTAQWLYFCYMRGSGGLAESHEPQAVAREEFDYLMKCFWLARYAGYLFFEANAEQSLATLLADSLRRASSQEAYPDAVPLLATLFNPSDLPMELADAALADFIAYDDIYQEACAMRTLGELSFDAGQYEQAVDYYSEALACVNFHHQCYYAAAEIVDPAAENHLLLPYDPRPEPVSVERLWMDSPGVKTVPEWIAGIRQQLSVAYSALDMKAESDYNRNIFLDLLDITRQDAELESRADELAAEQRQQRRNIVAVVATALLLGLLVVLLLWSWKRKSRAQRKLIEIKVQEIQETAQRRRQLLADEQEQLDEQQRATELRLLADKQQNVEKRAKLQLVSAIMPFLDRIIHEANRMRAQREVRPESLAYISELTSHINELNDLLTEWIQMQQGQLSLHISTFSLEELFASLRQNHYAFDQKGIELKVDETDLTVKADKALTLFMVNTLADNARKFTPTGGSVRVEATAGDDEDGSFVELAVEDTGCGLSADDVALILNNKVYDAAAIGSASGKGFGFGLMNCKGIIEKYRKTNALFRVCRFGVESRIGEGSRFWFRLPRVLSAMLMAFVLNICTYAAGAPMQHGDGAPAAFPAEAYALADSVYFCNLDGRYAAALHFADSALALIGTGRDSLDYSLVLGLRNEQAVAALALHDWTLYRRSNDIYTRLYKHVNRDETLESYVLQLERSRQSSRLTLVAIVVLLALALLAALFFYILPQLRFSRTLARLDEERLAQLREEKSAEHERQQTDVEMAEDEHRRRLYEESRLHVQNQIIDNCLSTIKHETMYYPVRINQLVAKMQTSDTPAEQIDTLCETAAYYKEVYALLSAQARQQSEALNFRRRNVGFGDVAQPAIERFRRRVARQGLVVGVTLGNVIADSLMRCDPDLIVMLLNELLDAETDFMLEGSHAHLQPLTLAAGVSGAFARIELHNPNVELQAETLASLFAPHHQGIAFLIARQIIREHDTFMGHPGCRICAEAATPGHVIWFTIPLSS